MHWEETAPHLHLDTLLVPPSFRAVAGVLGGGGGILLTRAYLLQSDGTTSYTFRKTPLVLPSVRIPGVYPARVPPLTL